METKPQTLNLVKTNPMENKRTPSTLDSANKITRDKLGGIISVEIFAVREDFDGALHHDVHGYLAHKKQPPPRTVQ